jgi:hypothetical protein
MSASLDSIFSLEVLAAGYTPRFQLSNYTRREEPILDQAGARHGRKVTLSATGWVEASSGVSIGAAANSTVAAVSFLGKTVRLKRYGSVEFELASGGAIDGGPRCSITIEPHDGEDGVRPATIEVEASYVEDPYEQQLTPTWPYVEVETVRADGLRSVRRSGLILETGGAYTNFITDVLVTFQSDYPPAEWITTHEIDRTHRGDRISFTLTAAELRAEYPTDVKDGERVVRRVVEESGRVTLEYSYNFLLAPTASYSTVLAALRPAGTIIRESTEVTNHRELRLSATFVVLESTGVIESRQTVEIEENPPVLTVKRYSGTAPIAVEDMADFRIVSVNGYCIATTAQNMPAAISEDFVTKPVVARERLSPAEVRTTWSYKAILDDATEFDVAWLVG